MGPTPRVIARHITPLVLRGRGPWLEEVRHAGDVELRARTQLLDRERHVHEALPWLCETMEK